MRILLLLIIPLLFLGCEKDTESFSSEVEFRDECGYTHYSDDWLDIRFTQQLTLEGDLIYKGKVHNVRGKAFTWCAKQNDEEFMFLQNERQLVIPSSALENGPIEVVASINSLGSLHRGRTELSLE